MSDFFNFDFEAFEKSGLDKNDAINYLKSLESNIDFNALENNVKAYNEKNKTNFTSYDILKHQGKNISFKQRPREPNEEERFKQSLAWLSEDQQQSYNLEDCC